MGGVTLIEKAKHFGGELNITGFSHFVEKIIALFRQTLSSGKFDNLEFFLGAIRSGLCRHNCINGDMFNAI